MIVDFTKIFLIVLLIKHYSVNQVQASTINQTLVISNAESLNKAQNAKVSLFNATTHIEEEYRENFIRLIENFLLRHMRKILFKKINETNSTKTLINITTAASINSKYYSNNNRTTKKPIMSSFVSKTSTRSHKKLNQIIKKFTFSNLSYTKKIELNKKFGECNFTSTEALIKCKNDGLFFNNNNQMVMVTTRLMSLRNLSSHSNHSKAHQRVNGLLYENVKDKIERKQLINYYKSYFIYFVSIIIFLSTISILLLVIVFISCILNCKQRNRLQRLSDNEFFTYYNRHLPMISSVSSFSLTPANQIGSENRERSIRKKISNKCHRKKRRQTFHMSNNYVNNESYIQTLTHSNSNNNQNLISTGCFTAPFSTQMTTTYSNEQDFCMKSTKIFADTNNLNQTLCNRPINFIPNCQYQSIQQNRLETDVIDEDDNATIENGDINLVDNCNKYLFNSNLNDQDKSTVFNKNIISSNQQDDLVLMPDTNNKYSFHTNSDNKISNLSQNESKLENEINRHEKNDQSQQQQHAEASVASTSNYIRDRYYQILREQVFPFLQQSRPHFSQLNINDTNKLNHICNDVLY